MFKTLKYISGDLKSKKVKSYKLKSLAINLLCGIQLTLLYKALIRLPVN